MADAPTSLYHNADIANILVEAEGSPALKAHLVAGAEKGLELLKEAPYVVDNDRYLLRVNLNAENTTLQLSLRIKQPLHGISGTHLGAVVEELYNPTSKADISRSEEQRFNNVSLTSKAGYAFHVMADTIYVVKRRHEIEHDKGSYERFLGAAYQFVKLMLRPSTPDSRNKMIDGMYRILETDVELEIQAIRDHRAEIEAQKKADEERKAAEADALKEREADADTSAGEGLQTGVSLLELAAQPGADADVELVKPKGIQRRRPGAEKLKR